MRPRLYQVLMILIVVLMALPASLVVAANPPEPTYCEEHPPIPVVDGNYTEWDLALDFFANVTDDPLANGAIVGKLYLRYDWYAQVLYALVLFDSPRTLDIASPQSHRITLESNLLVDGTDLDSGTVPNMSWIYDGTAVVGWEASAAAPAGTYHNLSLFARTLDNGVSTASGVCCLDLVLGLPTAVDLASFTAEAAGPAIQLAWQTATEVDNLGFNLYRAESVEGTLTLLNAALIPGQLPGSPVGGTYTYLDTTVQRGLTYYYWLEDIDLHGATALHGPVSAALKIYVKVLPGRPRPTLAPVRFVQQIH